MLKLLKELNAPDGQEVITTYYPSIDNFEGCSEAMIRVQCDQCKEIFWIEKVQQTKILGKCPFCGS